MAGQVNQAPTPNWAHVEYNTATIRMIEATIPEPVMEALRELPRPEGYKLLKETLGMPSLSVIDAMAICDMADGEGYEWYVLDDGNYAIIHIEFSPVWKTEPPI